MAITFTIAGTNRATQVLVKTLRIQKRGPVETCAAEVIADGVTAGTYRPTIGEAVRVSDPNGLLFGGLITTVKDREAGPQTTITALECRDWSILTDDAVVTLNYPAGLGAYTILHQLWQAFLAPKGVTWASPTSGGPVMPAFVWDHQTVRTCINQLVAAAGQSWAWWIQGDRIMFAGPIGTSYATNSPLNMTNARVKHVRRPLSWDLNAVQQANAVFLRTGGSGETTHTDTHTGNGVKRYFVTHVEPTTPPTSVTETVGGVPTSYPTSGPLWTWMPGVNALVRSSPLASGATVAWTGKVTLPVWVRAYAAEALSADGLPNRTVIVERALQAHEIASISQAVATARGYLAQRASAEQVVEVITHSGAWWPTLKVRLDFPQRLIAGDYLIDEVSIQDIGHRATAEPFRLQYTLKCRAGIVNGRSAIDWWRTALSGQSGGSSTLGIAPILIGTTPPAAAAPATTVYLGSSQIGTAAAGWWWPPGTAQMRLRAEDYPLGVLIVAGARLDVGGGATFQLRLRNLDASTTAGTSPTYTQVGATQEHLFSAALQSGTHLYRLEANVSDDATPIRVDYAYVLPVT